MHVIAAKGRVAFGEACSPNSRSYARARHRQRQGARRAAQGARRGPRSGRHRHASRAGRSRSFGITGKDADEALERSSITCNKNGVPLRSPAADEDQRQSVGSPAGTTRGFGVQDFRDIGDMIADVLEGLEANGEEGNRRVEAEVKGPRSRALRPLPDLSGGIGTPLRCPSALMKTAR
jgi:glycine hydroxymethyltransferase